MKTLLNRLFKLEERKSKAPIEIIAGLITFLAMIYILPTNSSILGDMGMSKEGVFAATAIVSGIVSIIMGLYGNFPVILSAGMGVNAYLAYTIFGQMGDSWTAALLLMFLAGIIFLIITLTPIRTMIINAIPNDLKYIISAGLGGFIAFVGLKNSGIIVASGGTLVTLGDFSNPATLLAVFGVLIVFVLLAVKVKWVNQMAIPIAMVVTAVIGVMASALLPDATGLPSFGGNFGLSGLEDVAFKIFDGDDWVAVLTNPASYGIIFSLIFVNLFDTTATLMAVGRGAGMVDKEGTLLGGKKAVLADAIGAAICAPLGTSTVTSFAESGIAVETGAKTGLAAVTAGVLFLLSAFIYPVFSIFSSYAVTSMALISVGALMFFGNLRDINWDDRVVVYTAFITVVMMILTYSISDGLGFGLILYIAMMLARKQGKQISPTLYVVGVLFLTYYVLKVFIK